MLPTLKYSKYDGSFSFSEGKYLITDPSYVWFTDADWEGCIGAFDALGAGKEGIVCCYDDNDVKHANKHQNIYLWKTQYGDGLYPIYNNNEEIAKAPVDTGLLSIFPVSLLSTEVFGDKYGALSHLSTEITIDAPTKPQQLFNRGDVAFGRHKIETAGTDTVTYRAWKKAHDEGTWREGDVIAMELSFCTATVIAIDACENPPRVILKESRKGRPSVSA